MNSRRKFFAIAVVFEAGLGILALGLGWLLRFPPTRTIVDGQAGGEVAVAALWGLAATVPMVAALVLVDRFPGPLENFKDYVGRELVPLFRGLSIGQIAIISAAAGIGEELFFRGLLQDGLSQWLGGPAGTAWGLIVASLVFGICHWVTSTYAALATLVGLYLGILFLQSESLLAPIVTHACYDFLALLYLVRPGSTDSKGERAATDDASDAGTAARRGTESTGGDSTGGDSTGGDSTGGDSAGGDSAGGDSAGGNSTGGDSTGGDSTGGDSAGGEIGGAGPADAESAEAECREADPTERASRQDPEKREGDF